VKLTATVELDLTAEDQPLRAASVPLSAVPDGCRVALRVREDQWPDVLAFGLVQDHLDRLGELDIRCPNTATIRLWHAVLSGDNPWRT
jgi:hypothetical protein